MTWQDMPVDLGKRVRPLHSYPANIQELMHPRLASLRDAAREHETIDADQRGRIEAGLPRIDYHVEQILRHLKIEEEPVKTGGSEFQKPFWAFVFVSVVVSVALFFSSILPIDGLSDSTGSVILVALPAYGVWRLLKRLRKWRTRAELPYDLKKTFAKAWCVALDQRSA